MKNRFLFLLVFFFACGLVTAKVNTDSLRRLIEITEDDTLKAKYWNNLSLEYSYAGYYELAERAAYEALDLSRRNNFARGEADAFYHLGISFSKRAQFDKATEWFLKAIGSYDNLGDAKGKGFSIMLIGVMHYDLKNYAKAEEEYNKALDIFKKGDVISGIANCLVNLGYVYADKAEYDKAVEYSDKAYQIFKKYKSYHGMAECMTNIANVYSARFRMSDSLGNKDLAQEYLSRAVKAYRDNILTYQQLAMPVEQSQQYLNLFNLFLKKDAGTARKYLDSASAIITGVNSIFNQYLVSHAYYRFYLNVGDSAKALAYFLNYTQLRDSVFNAEKAEKLKALNVQIKEIEKQKEIDLLTKEKEKKTLVLWGIAVLSVFLLSFILFLSRRYSEKKKANDLLEEKNKTIANKNKEIIDSINYACRIQSALILPESEISRHFSEVFVLYKPKDIVSGDFYWFSESKKNKIIAVADCTGHGVPGGFMSMLGHEMLQDLLLKESIETTSEALHVLDKKITNTLNKSDMSFRDGMDLALCAFSKETNKVQFSGANRPLLHIRDGKLTEFKPDKNTLGGNIEGIEKKYSHIDIALQKGDQVYLFTDGFADQFGGPAGKKLKYKQLQALIIQYSKLSMSAQKKCLDEAFENWKGSQEQVDDVCLIGIRV